MPNNCPLCNNSGDVFYEYKSRLYYQCTVCKGVFIDVNLVPSSGDEKLRYEEHNNDVHNKGYQNFVSPITKAILKNFTPDDKGLDFGAGTGPVISKILKDNAYNIVQYDPFFHNYPELLDASYHYIACCEVIEHFHHPRKEFALLKTLLKPKGKLYCMTDLFDESIDFHKWYYKNDETHVFIFTKTTIEWVKKEIGFSQVEIDGRLIIFSK
ncbi:MAG: class I SAM-dependent methyltransferase [Salinivirgaceae bacterium]|nr:class I SAM-dependent methyltransferase [Salinivirgaceae bacterium]